MEEIWDLVDNNGSGVGIKWSRGDDTANIPEGCYHPCVEVFVKVGDELIITRRHPSKSEGLRYDSPGGAVLLGESFVEGALRELFEETGIVAMPDDLKCLGAAIRNKVYAVSFLLKLDRMPELKLQPTEVVEYKLVTKDLLEKMLCELCDGCRERYLMYQKSIF